MSLFSSFTKRQSSLCMAVDIGAYAIKAIAYYADRNGLPRMVKKIIAKLPVSGDEFRITQQLHELFFSAAKEFGRVPQIITVGVGPPFVEYELKRFSVQRENASGALQGGALADIFNRAIADSSYGEGTMAYPLGLYANGYWVTPRTVHISGLANTKELTFSALLIKFSPAAYKALNKTRAMLGGIAIDYVPLGLAYHEAVRKILGLHDYFLIDIGERHTMLMRAREDALNEIVNMPYGFGHMTNELAKTWSLTPDEAINMFNLYTEEGIDKMPQGTAEAMQSEVAAWQSAFIGALDRFYNTGPLSEEVLLSGGGARVPDIRELLIKGKWMRGYSYTDHPHLRILEGQNLFGGDTLGGFLRGPEEFGLGALIMYSLYHESIF